MTLEKAFVSSRLATLDCFSIFVGLCFFFPIPCSIPRNSRFSSLETNSDERRKRFESRPNFQRKNLFYIEPRNLYVGNNLPVNRKIWFRRNSKNEKKKFKKKKEKCWTNGTILIWGGCQETENINNYLLENPTSEVQAYKNGRGKKNRKV